MKKNWSTIALVLILIVGLSLMLYPGFSDWWNSMHQTRAVASYMEQVAVMEDDQYEQLWNDAWNYNRSLMDRHNSFVLTEEQNIQYNQLLNIGGNGIMGYVEIPDINVTLPVYHGTDESVLQIAVGHLEWSSLPVGGAGSHCVLSGHRGLPSARLFTDLDKMEAGDIFRMYVLDEVLTYQVDRIHIVEPEEVEDLLIQEGEDLCTLVTCTPYGINSHRMLVRGHRIETTEERVIHITSDAVQIDPLIVAPFVASPMLLFLLVLLLIPKKRRRKS